MKFMSGGHAAAGASQPQVLSGEPPSKTEPATVVSRPVVVRPSAVEPLKPELVALPPSESQQLRSAEARRGSESFASPPAEIAAPAAAAAQLADQKLEQPSEPKPEPKSLLRRGSVKIGGRVSPPLRCPALGRPFF